MTPTDIIEAARECLGTPFRHQGRKPGEAIDCAGVAVHVASRLGFGVMDVDGYGRVPVNGQLEATLEAQEFLHSVEIWEASPGDILLMRFAGEPQHLAILADGTIIHAYEPAGLCCEHNLTNKWSSRVVGAYRFAGLE